MTVASQTLTDLNQAIRKFGSYNLHDKGADEVMDVEEITTRLRDAGIDESVKTLEQLTLHEDGQPLISYLISFFVEDDEWPEFAEALAAVPTLREQFVPWLNADGEPV